MMKSIRKTACALTVLAATTSSVMAAETIDLKVTGKIVPAACTPNLPISAVVDYGNIYADVLTPTDYADLGVKSVNFTVTCDAAAKIALKAVNGRPGSVVSTGTEGTDGFAPAPINLFGSANEPAAGLGFDVDGTTKIGGFAARLSNVDADSNTPDLITSIDGGSVWAKSTVGTVTANSQLISFAATSTLLPVAVTAVTADLDVNAYLNKPEDLDLTKAITLDGLTTIEVVYL